jgi:hypothetical protein
MALPTAGDDALGPVQPLAGSGAGGSTLIFGDGDNSDGLPNPLEPLENLRKILTRAGSSVTVSKHLPLRLRGIHTIWFVGNQPLSSAERTELTGFVRNGGGLYLTGERICCEEENRADEAIIDQLATLRPTRVGDGADVDDAYLFATRSTPMRSTVSARSPTDSPPGSRTRRGCFQVWRPATRSRLATRMDCRS